MTNLETRQKVRLVTIIAALTIEVGTGMKMSRGVQPLQALKHDFPNFKGNKKAGLQFAVDRMKDLDSDYKISTSTLKALS